ncbi:hypothetical protein EW146_g4810 [Bondarzewia mesenterica]|uniref:Peptidase M48 domain-containing protein n=1 Tax=Bondarzewia mesenterica TaxID=1095465 RepID=A0A4S4LVJ2_9AGAM|nr:hypothetical protein EW146_g4810 [Bondarzewia mesenterica]
MLLEEFRGHILPQNHPITRHVHTVVSRILEANNLGFVRSSELGFLGSSESVDQTSEFWDVDADKTRAEISKPLSQREWQLVVVNDAKVMNAMALPGAIVVFTGILPVCKDEQGLAAVIGHVARHSGERYSQAKIFLLAAFFLEALGFGHSVTSIVTTFIIELPNSRTQELEADTIGLRLAAKACFDPRAAPELFARLAEVEKGRTGAVNLDFFSTHPLSEKRIRLLEQQLPEAYAIQAASAECGGLSDHMAAFRDSFTGSPW